MGLSAASAVTTQSAKIPDIKRDMEPEMDFIGFESMPQNALNQRRMQVREMSDGNHAFHPFAMAYDSRTVHRILVEHGPKKEIHTEKNRVKSGSQRPGSRRSKAGDSDFNNSDHPAFSSYGPELRHATSFGGDTYRTSVSCL